jgi:hypothetical protein
MTFNTPHLDKNTNKKGIDKEDIEPEDKSGGAQFENALKTVNVIIGGECGFASKRAQKLKTRLGFQAEKESKQTKMGFDFRKSFAQMNENSYLSY